VPRMIAPRMASAVMPSSSPASVTVNRCPAIAGC
jgi:hypothetical protein